MVPKRLEHALTDVITPASQRAAAAINRRAMIVLLVVLVLASFVVPVIPGNVRVSRFVSDVLITVMLAAGIFAVSGHRRITMALVGFSIVAIGLRWLVWIAPQSNVIVFRDASILLTVMVLAVAVGINVFSENSVLSDRIIGAVVLYLLIGLDFAVGYSLVAGYFPQAFNVSPAVANDASEWFYFSFVTLTTVGYGDVAPQMPLSRSMATFEALIGQLYPAVILARLVALPRKPGASL